MSESPRCEHCAYDLAGIAVREFIARCPECGRDSDIRRVPRPVIPLWHTPAAILAGMVAICIAFFAITLAGRMGLFTAYNAVRTSSIVPLSCIGVGGAFALFLLRKDYLARWRYAYGPGWPPARAWISVLVDWVVTCIAIGILLTLTFIGFHFLGL